MTSKDDGVSDVVGTMLMLGVTVMIVGAAAFAVLSRPETKAPAARLDLVAAGVQGRTTLTLLHAGGDNVDAGALRAVVLANGTKTFDGPAGANGAVWRVGDALTVGPLAFPLAMGARVTVSIVDTIHGQTLATSSIQIPIAAAPIAASAFGVSPISPGGGNLMVVEPPAEILLEASVNHVEGRKFVRYVYADLTPVAGPAFKALADAGVNGDRVSGDGIYGALLLVPLNVTSGNKVINVTAVDFNGTSTTSTATLSLLRRDEASEETLNPTSAPTQPPAGGSCPAGNAAVTSFRYLVNGVKQFNDMTGNIRQGDHVKATVTLAPACSGIQLTLVSYTAPTPYFAWTNAYQQVPYRTATGTFNGGDNVLEVDVPTCFFQIDLVRGAVIVQLGANALGQPDPNGNAFYSRQGRLLDADNGGTTACP